MTFESNSARQFQEIKLVENDAINYEKHVFHRKISSLLSGTYEQIRQSGFLTLPHKSTLQQYTGCTDIVTSFNPDILKKYANEMKL